MKHYRLKQILVSFTIISLFLFPQTISMSYAQIAESNECVTKVGQPEDEKPVGCDTPSNGSGGRPGQPLPSQDVTVIKQKLCSEYKVCPTENAGTSTPNRAWTLQQLTALWNIVQKIYESPTYKALAIGNYTLEMQRAGCYPGGCDDTWGYYAGQTQPAWARVPGSRLIVITNNIQQAGSLVTMEWLFAHEIGHSASGGLPNGGLAPYLGQNEAYRRVAACGEIISQYGYTNTNENNSEILAFYMTAGEEAIAGYRGPAKNLARDYQCTYNATKSGYFNGVEY